MDYKTETKTTYDLFATFLDGEYGRHFNNYVKEFADNFVRHVGIGKSVLDLGSGPGHHAKYFQKQGIDVLCADLSEKMIELCHAKGLRAIDMDIENINLPKNSFDGVWAYTSLLHVPKNKISGVISRIECILKPQGILGLAVKEGIGECLEYHENLSNKRRYFSYYTDEEIRKLFKNFMVLEFKKPKIEKTTFLNYLMRLNKPME